MWLWTMLAFVTTTIWGWVVNRGVSLAAPLVILFLAGMSLSGPISVLTILLVDLYPMNAGRASSSFNLTRAGISAAGTAVVQYLSCTPALELTFCPEYPCYTHASHGRDKIVASLRSTGRIPYPYMHGRDKFSLPSTCFNRLGKNPLVLRAPYGVHTVFFRSTVGWTSQPSFNRQTLIN